MVEFVCYGMGKYLGLAWLLGLWNGVGGVMGLGFTIYIYMYIHMMKEVGRGEMVGSIGRWLCFNF